MKMPKKRNAPTRDFAQSAAVVSVVLGRPRNIRMIRFTMGLAQRCSAPIWRMLAKASLILLLCWRTVDSLTGAHALRPAAQRIGLQLQRAALTVSAMPRSPDARTLPTSGTPSCLLSAASPCLVQTRPTSLEPVVGNEVRDRGETTRSKRSADQKGGVTGRLCLLTTGGLIGVRQRAPQRCLGCVRLHAH